MKLKYLYNQASGNYQMAIEQANKWLAIKGCNEKLSDMITFSEKEIMKRYELISLDLSPYKEVLPFRPTAYRDYMLYENHMLNAARGFVKKYMPGQFRIVKAYEKIMRKPFPKLRPSHRYYQHPIFYMGNHLNFISNYDSVAIPAYTKELDYELEIGAFITKPLKNASIEEVIDAIGGFVILNDFTARDVQLDEIATGFGPMKAKNFANAISSVVVSKDDLFHQLENLSVKVFINRELIAKNTTKGKLFSFPEAIAYASSEEQLHPGELFGSGTVPGCTGIENGAMLKKGDEITLEVEGIGQLTNSVA